MVNHWRVSIRPFTWDDLYSLQALINIIADHDRDGYTYSLEWLYFVLDKPAVDATKNCFIATLPNDRIIGYSRVEDDAKADCVRVYGGVHPDYRNLGIGRWLIQVNDFNLLSQRPPHQPLTILRPVNTPQPSIKDLLGYAGYQPSAEAHIWQKTLSY